MGLGTRLIMQSSLSGSRGDMFQRFVESNPTVKGEEGAYHAGYLLEHTAQLLAVLRRHVLHHEFGQAAATMESVTMVMDKALEIARKVGIECLAHTKDSYSECLQLFKQIFSKYNQEETLLEMCLFIASSGNLQEAHATMESYIYHKNPLYHGYCGLLQYMLWRRGDASGTDIHAQNALYHFKELQDMVVTGTMKIDLFVYKHAELLLSLDQEERAFDLLENHRDQHPDQLNPNRYFCDHLRHHRHCNKDLRVFYLRKLLSIDDSCQEAMELTEILLEGDSPYYEECLKVLLEFLDYPVNGSCSRAWELLKRLQSDWSGFERSAEWTSRLKWWRKLYPDDIAAIFNSDINNSVMIGDH